jgi:uncharacterized protein (TIGR02646 family)
MRTIHKGDQPPELQQWMRSNTNGRYEHLSSDVRRTIRQQALKEQFHLCAYCCQEINEGNCHNEHVEPQKLDPNRTVDYSNIVASCNTKNQCGNAHGSAPLPLTPLMQECENELKFMRSGRVRGLTQRAETTIQVLNLGDSERSNKSLIQKRKIMIDSVLFSYSHEPDSVLEDDELLKLIINELSSPQGEKMQPFAPVLINILRDMLAPPPRHIHS